jgi:Uma2 family endonuclease
MASVKLEKRATIEDLQHTPKDGRKYELVDGEIVVSPGGFRHSEVGTKIILIIGSFLSNHPIAKVFGADLGIVLGNGDLRSPDVTVLGAEKVPVGDAAIGFLETIPDLVVEVLSPNDSLKHVGEKIGEFLECGVPLVWLVDPAERTVTSYRSLSRTERYTEEDTITAESVLPGFSCRVSDFF